MKYTKKSPCDHIFGNTLGGGLISRADIEAGTYSFRDLVFKFKHCPNCRAALTIFGEHHILNAPSIAFREYTILGEEGNRTAIKVEPLYDAYLCNAEVEYGEDIIVVYAHSQEEAIETLNDEGYTEGSFEIEPMPHLPKAEYGGIGFKHSSDGISVFGEDIA